MEKWKYVWSQIQTDHRHCPMYVENGTQQIKLHCPVNGNKIRIRVSNLYGTEPAHLQEVSLSIVKKGMGRTKQMTFGRKQDVVLHVGETRYCDAVCEEVNAGDELVVSIYFKERTVVTSRVSFCSPLLAETAQSQGNRCGEIQQNHFKDGQEISICFLDSVEVCPETTVCTFAAFGDSITQQGQWTGALQRICSDRSPGKVSVYNCGIGGNRMLHDTPQPDVYYQAFGRAGMERFEEDVFYRDVKPDVVFLLEGVNDVSHPYYIAPMSEIVTAEEMIGGYQRLFDICRKYEVKTVLSTILPFGNYMSGWNPQAERLRQQINEWIRSTGECDKMIDLDRYMKENGVPEKLADRYDCGDGLHVNAEGGKRMAEIVYGELFLI